MEDKEIKETELTRQAELTEPEKAEEPMAEPTGENKGGVFKKKKNSREEKLEARVAELEEQVLAAREAYYRAYADADNLKKRLQSQADEQNKYRIQKFALEILPAMDSLELALKGKDENDPFVRGVKLTYDKITNALASEGVTQIDCLNQKFDANLEHALMTEKVEGVEPDMVVEVLQPGYMIKDRLLRAALVKVSE